MFCFCDTLSFKKVQGDEKQNSSDSRPDFLHGGRLGGSDRILT